MRRNPCRNEPWKCDGFRAQLMLVDYKSITLDDARKAILAYNASCYTDGLKSTEIDEKACALFQTGLAPTLAEIERQVRFIAVDYGGIAGFRAATALIPKITHDIYDIRDRYADLTMNARPLREGVAPVRTIEVLFKPFMRSEAFYNKHTWQVWAAKFLHFLNPDAFPIEDSRVDKFFHISGSNSPEKYLRLASRFRDFALSHQSWLAPLRELDGDPECSDNKLWDKVCYGVME